MHSVYILQSLKDKSLYVGYSSDIKQRYMDHQKGRVYSTKNKLPLDMMHCELYKNRKDAMQMEKFFKSGWGRNYIRKVLYHTLEK